MAKQMQRYHTSSRMLDIVKGACRSMDDGTCDRAKPHSGTAASTFGRLFTKVDLKDQPEKEALRKLADDMNEGQNNVNEGTADAGMAFFGQFIDHDLTLDATTRLGSPVDDLDDVDDVDDITNFRTPRLDLDCVYGDGPEVSPWLYDGPRLLFGREAGEDIPETNPLDLARNRVGTALIGDPRNDENLFLSQVHGRMFVKRHNDIVDAWPGNDEKRFEHARDELREFYHRMIVCDFLPQVVHKDVLGPLVKNAKDAAKKNKHHLSKTAGIDWSKAPDMPVEFSGAVFRFGHTWIRQFYRLNHNEKREKVAIFANPNDEDSIDLKGFNPVDRDNNLLMSLFFGEDAQRAGRIDTRIPDALLNLPAEVVGAGERNLAFRNMFRGQHTFLIPPGEAIADQMKFPKISPDQRIKALGLEGKTPLWFYTLSEAEQNGDFLLHNVGGTLVAGVLLNLLLKAKSPFFFKKPDTVA